MLTNKELQSLRNMGNECERAADEIELLRQILGYGVDILTPSRIDGPTYHHVKIFLSRANSALATIPLAPPADI